jgi:hypothetical protein
MPKRTGWRREFDDPIELPGQARTFVTLAIPRCQHADGISWQHFYCPDGTILEISGPGAKPVNIAVGTRVTSRPPLAANRSHRTGSPLSSCELPRFILKASSFQGAVVITGRRILECACSDGGDSLPITE